MAETTNIVPQSGWMGLGNNPDAQTYSTMQQNLQKYGQQAQQLAAGNALSNLQYQKGLTDTPIQTDLSPLVALTDSWTGSKLAQGYKQPETVQDRQALMQKLQGELDKNSQGMSEQQVQLLKAQLETQARKEDRQASLANTQAQRDVANAIHGQTRDDKITHQQQERQDKQDQLTQKAFDTARSGYMSDTSDLRKKQVEFDDLNSLLDQSLTNPASAKALAIKRARFEVPSRLSDTEINALGYKDIGDFSNRFEQAVQNATEGTITPENYKAIKDSLTIQGQNLNSAIAQKTADHATAYARKTGKAPEDALYDLTGSRDTSVLQPKQPAAQAAPAKQFSSGDVVKGPDGNYQFNGGDSKNIKNWTKVE